MVSTITSKGQLTVPKKIRKQLNIHPGDKIEFLMDNNNNCRIVPVRSSIKDLKGILGPVNKTVSLEEMQNAIEKEALK